MSSPELPQPIYPGATGAGRPAAPPRGGPGGGGPFGYAPVAPGSMGVPPGQTRPAFGPSAGGFGPSNPAPNGGPPGGHHGPPGRGGGNRPGLIRWLAIGGGALGLLIIAIVAITMITRPAAGPATTTQAGEGPSTQTQSGVSDTGSSSEGGQGTGTDMNAVVAGLFAGLVTSNEQSCLVDAANGNAQLAQAMTDWNTAIAAKQGRTLTSSNAALIADATVSCLGSQSLQTLVTTNPATPSCPEYADFSSVPAAQLKTFMTDFYLTFDGSMSTSSFGQTYFDMSACTLRA